MDQVKTLIRDIPDFPKKGIVFKDITPLLADGKAFARVTELFASHLASRPVDLVLGIESRGFIFGSALANLLGKGFVPARKPGKLPYHTVRESYALEYGTDAIEVHRDAIGPGERVVVVDDLLATGGTLSAAMKLVQQLGGQIVAGLVVIELGFLDGRKRVGEHEIVSLIRY
jgi:adenine phosphoribosyltransferase